jgi:hypothetical protein
MDTEARTTAQLCLASSTLTAADVESYSAAVENSAGQERNPVREACFAIADETAALQDASHRTARRLVDESAAATTRSVSFESAQSSASTPLLLSSDHLQQRCSDLSLLTAADVSTLSTRTKSDVDASSDSVVAAIRAL